MTTAAHSPTFGKVKPRRSGVRAWLTHHSFRRIMQLGVFAFLAVIASGHLLAGESSTTVTASWEAFCPMGGLETLYKYITGGAYVSHTHLSNIVLLGATLVTAVVARNAFCGWICPFGFIQDMVSSFSALIQKRVRPIRTAVRAIKSKGARLAILDRYLRFFKYAVLIWAVGGAAYFGLMVFRDYDPYAALWNLLDLALAPGTAVLAVVVIASLFVERPWCRYACPLGAVTGLVSKVSPFYLKREADACKACAICTKACPMGLPVHSAVTIKSVECIGCLECIGECPREGALDLKLGVPALGK